MENEIQDGNQNGVSQPDAESSAAQNESKQGFDDSQSSAETVKTEKNKESEYIPKARFNEVYGKYKELESKSESFKIYEELENIFETKPELYEKFLNALSESQKEAIENLDNEKGNSSKDPKIDNLEKTVSELSAFREQIEREKTEYIVQQKVGAIDSHFSQLTKDIPEHEKGMILEMVGTDISRKYGENSLHVTPEIIDASFKAQVERLESLKKQVLKNAMAPVDRIPQIGGSGKIPQTVPSEMSTFERARLLEQRIKNAV